MGFDIFIQCPLNLCQETGKPFYFGKNGKVYDISIVVPEQFRKFLHLKGSIFQAYIDDFCEDCPSILDIDRFKENFPPWSKVQEYVEEKEAQHIWTMDDHLSFYDALEWFSKQEAPFDITWSY